MAKVLGRTYDFFITFPDRFYPFANVVNGRRLRGIRSYQQAAARALRKNGPGKIGFKLVVYRQTFHFAGSILFIAVSTLLARELFGSEAALYVLFYAAIAALTYQEFYVHPRRYQQRLGKGLLDWSFWVVPMLLYLYR